MRSLSLAAILLFTFDVFAAPVFGGYWSCVRDDGTPAGTMYVDQTADGLTFYEQGLLPQYQALGAIQCPSVTRVQGIELSNDQMSLETECDDHVYSVHSQTRFGQETQSDFSISRYSELEIRIHFRTQSKIVLWWETMNEFNLACTQ